MRGRYLFIVALLLVWQTAGAVAINPSQNLGAVPLNSGTGLLGSYYKFGSSANIGTLANANLLISASGGPTATFKTTTVCFPDCANGNLSDSSSVSSLFNGHVSDFVYGVPNSQIPTSIDHSAIVLTGYIAITQAGTYNFNLGSDDGSQLTIGGQTVVGNDNDHSYQVNSGSASFTTAGLYAISLQFFEDSGATGLELYASGPSGTCIIGRASNCASGSAATSLFYSSLPTPAVPEPGALGIFGAGLCGIAIITRRRRVII